MCARVPRAPDLADVCVCPHSHPPNLALSAHTCGVFGGLRTHIPRIWHEGRHAAPAARVPSRRNRGATARCAIGGGRNRAPVLEWGQARGGEDVMRVLGMGPTELLMVLVPILLTQVVPWVLFVVLTVLAIRWFLRQERASQDPKDVAARRSLGEVLRAHRERCKMTQELVAEKLGVSRQAVSKWEQGKSEAEHVQPGEARAPLWRGPGRPPARGGGVVARRWPLRRVVPLGRRRPSRPGCPPAGFTRFWAKRLMLDGSVGEKNIKFVAHNPLRRGKTAPRRLRVPSRHKTCCPKPCGLSQERLAASTAGRKTQTPPFAAFAAASSPWDRRWGITTSRELTSEEAP